MTNIKLIEPVTNISKLKMTKMPWDVVVNKTPYQVVRIEGYVHSIGGRWGNNDYWMYARHVTPFAHEDVCYYEEDYVKADIFDKHIWWFRE